MLEIKKVLYFIFSSFVLNSFGQLASPDCILTSKRLCDTTLFIKAFYSLNPVYGTINDLPIGNNVSNPSSNPASSNSGCLPNNESNPTWAILEVTSGGTLGFYIGVGGNQTGWLDWILWPYDSIACNKILSNLLPPIRCNWNSSSTGGTGIGPVPTGGVAGNFEPILNVNAGDKFVLCLNNFSNIFTNSWKFQKIGTASLGCNIVSLIDEQNSGLTQTLDLWPNPTSDKLQIKSNDNIGLLEIVDLSGKLYTSESICEKAVVLNVTEFPNGIYIVRTKNGYQKLSIIHQ